MEKELILELNNHNIYYVKTEKINFYITIPKKFTTTNICLELNFKEYNKKYKYIS